MKHRPAILRSAVAILGTCGVVAAPAAELEGVEWRLIELRGQPVVAPAEGRGAPTLKLDAAKQGAGGFSGVNRFFGSYERAGATLKFGALAGTRMAGPPAAMQAESAFLAALGSTDQWRLADGKLELLHYGKVLARFSAGAPVAGTEKGDRLQD